MADSPEIMVEYYEDLEKENESQDPAPADAGWFGRNEGKPKKPKE